MQLPRQSIGISRILLVLAAHQEGASHSRSWSVDRNLADSDRCHGKGKPIFCQ